MNWKEKMDALSSLDDDISIKYREASFISERALESWYVSQRVEIKVKGGGVVKSVSGNGNTPEEAIEDHWKQLTELKSDEYIVVNAGSDNRQAVKWNGFMWKRVKEYNVPIEHVLPE